MDDLFENLPIDDDEIVIDLRFRFCFIANSGIDFREEWVANLIFQAFTDYLPIVRKHAQQVIWLHQSKVMHGPVAEMLLPERLASIFEMEVS